MAVMKCERCPLLRWKHSRCPQSWSWRDSQSGDKILNKGEFAQEDYPASLADAYHRAGYIRKQRDILEQDYRLYADEEAFAALQELSVNLEEETEDIRERAQEMQHDLELPEYLDESVNLIDSEDWFLTMMPKLKEGQRNYYLERDSQPLLYVQTGYTEEGQCLKVWYTGNHTKRFLSPGGCNDPHGDRNTCRNRRGHRGSGRN